MISLDRGIPLPRHPHQLRNSDNLVVRQVFEDVEPDFERQGTFGEGYDWPIVGRSSLLSAVFLGSEFAAILFRNFQLECEKVSEIDSLFQRSTIL